MAKVSIELSEYESLLEDSFYLEALRQAGVDNWDGIDIAMEIYEELNTGVPDEISSTVH